MELLRFVKPDFYNRFQEDLMMMFVGEWLFSEVAFGRYQPRGVANASLLDLVQNTSQREKEVYGIREGNRVHTQSLDEHFGEILKDTKANVIPTYISRIKRVFSQHRAPIVGFTTTFNQNVPSLALAKALKESQPDSAVILGGANCEATMGPALLKAFPFVDLIVSGEGEESLPALVKTLLNGTTDRPRRLSEIRGVSYRDSTLVRVAPSAEPIRNLDKYPFMDCSDYFEQLESLEGDIGPMLEDTERKIFFECARGCWWGEHSHCTFCGLNGAIMNFRAKSAQRILDEILYLSEKHNVLNFLATDNILNPAYFASLLPRFAERSFDFQLFFEVKVNMTKRQIKTLSDSGVKFVQPGIESLSTHVLELMKKGTDKLRNIQSLKWFEQFGVRPGWNIIGGFPGETEEDYEEIEDTIPLIFHLTPPSELFQRIHLQRFSPNFDFASEFGFEDVKPLKLYKYIYDLGDDDLRDIAYYFEYRLPGFERFLPHIRRINSQIDNWHHKYYDEHTILKYKVGPGFILIQDSREDNSQTEFTLTGIERELFLLCDKISQFSEIIDMTKKIYPSTTTSDVRTSLQALEKDKLVISEGERYLSLPVAEKPVIETTQSIELAEVNGDSRVP